MLTKVDRTSMSHSLEVRAPFLDPALVELALSIPARRHFHAFAGKRLLRRALEGIVPDAILRAPKRGFEVPVGHWLTGPLDGLYREIVTPITLADLSGIDSRTAATWLEKHRAAAVDHGRSLWMLFALCFWRQGPHRRNQAAATEGRRQLRACSRSDATTLRRSEG
jgi:asparagine synthase (glutamine-hydrolysing)